MDARHPLIARAEYRPRPGCAPSATRAAISGVCAILVLALLRPAPLSAAPTTRPAPPPAATAPASPPSEEQLEAQARELQTLMTLVRKATLELPLRRQVARTLLDRGWPAALEALVGELSPRGEIATQQAIVQALTDLPDVPPALFIEPLLDLMDRKDDTILPDLAAALGRYPDTRLFQHIVTVAGDSDAPLNLRRGAVLTLSHHRTQDSGRTLIALIRPSQPPALREAAFTALEQLTGIDEFNHDPAQWEKWWAEGRRLPANIWSNRLFENYTRRNAQLTAQVQQAQVRLAELQRQLYRAAPAADRPAVLVAMLSDPVEGVRQAGVDLTLQWLTDRGTVSDELRDAVRARLDDPAPALRQRATLLLRDLADEKAADLVGRRLAAGEEKRPDLVRAYLLLMVRLPRRGGVDEALRRLSDRDLAPDAADALAAALDAKLIDAPRLKPALPAVRNLLTDDPPPDPRFIDLLARVGDAQDWKRIQGWLTHPTPAVKQAAARAWARSDQKLADLAALAGDALVLPILLEAAGRRGDEPAVLTAIIEHKPADEAGEQLWRKALVAMAARVPPGTVPAADRKLAARKEPLSDLRSQMLTAAIDRLLPAAPTTGAATATNPAAIKEPAALIDLLLARAELGLIVSNRQAALADLQRVAGLGLTPSAEQQRRLDLSLLQTKVLLADVEGLGDLARRVLGAGGAANGDPALTRKLVEPLLAVASAAASSQPEHVRQIALALRRLPAGVLPPLVEQPLRKLEAQVGLPPGGVDATRPADTQPASTRPATAPASQPVVARTKPGS